MLEYTENAKTFIEKGLKPLYEKYKNNETINGTVEIINAHLIFDAANDTIIDLGTVRKGQRKYVENELAWYLSLNRNIRGHKGIEENEIWSRICTDDGVVNSNYGFLVFSPENGDGIKSQYDFALEQLVNNPNGRQSIIFYNRPQMQWEWNDGINAKCDFTCTINTSHVIRNNELHYIVYMRSNDAIRGLHCGDLPWAGFVYNKMYEDLIQHLPDLKKGKIFWNATSFHIYERDYVLLKNIIEEYNFSCNKDSENNKQPELCF